MTLGFWQAQPGLAHGEYVAVLLAKPRAAVVIRSHLHAKACRKYNMTLAGVNR